MAGMLLASTQLAGFLAAAVLITLSPGPDNMTVLSMGATRGRACGMAFGHSRGSAKVGGSSRTREKPLQIFWRGVVAGSIFIALGLELLVTR
jgi:threonine/homoserine/homoserine lactone efflux protein